MFILFLFFPFFRSIQKAKCHKMAPVDWKLTELKKKVLRYKNAKLIKKTLSADLQNKHVKHVLPCLFGVSGNSCLVLNLF